MESYVLGDNLFKRILSSEPVSAVLSSLCRSVSGCSLSLCLQAAINNRHVFSVQTSLSLPSLCDTGHIIILRRNTNASAVVFLRSASCHFIMLVSCTEYTIIQKKSLQMGWIWQLHVYSLCGRRYTMLCRNRIQANSKKTPVLIWVKWQR